MKKVIVVSKTHLDLGFTDYAQNIKNQYLTSFIPGAINLANKVNTKDSKKFVWTTGSWILKEALNCGDEQSKSQLEQAIKDGSIVPHALPFTTHTELFDQDTFEYGLKIVEQLDKLRGSKTVAAKMTDVPGHTKGIVKLLAKHGIKLLHIGVNGASALPEVPKCFLWQDGDNQVVVIYSGDYGGAFKTDLTQEVLYFDHTLDNHGAPSPEKVLAKLAAIQEQFPDYQVEAGTLDEYAEIIWQQKDKLPIFEGELGDTWIHGAATDPYKSAALRTLMALKSNWLADGTMTKDSKEYADFCDALLCVGEHTCGMDTKTYFSDYEHYLKKDFVKARKADKVKTRRLHWDFPQNLYVLTGRVDGRRKQGYYSVLEKSWAEQRDYITVAVNALSKFHKEEAISQLDTLMPEKPIDISKFNESADWLEFKDWHLEINKNGGIKILKNKDDIVINGGDSPAVTYHSFTSKDYKHWFSHYTRDIEGTKKWSVGDFGRPCLKYFDGKYPEGRFEYTVNKIVKQNNTLTANLKCDSNLCRELGAPRLVQIVYSLCEKGLNISLSWFNKDANRLTESIYFHLNPVFDSLAMQKLGTAITPEEIASMGGKKLNAVEKVMFTNNNKKYEIVNFHSPLLSFGKGKILEYDNKIEDCKKDGISYVLCNNVWGTNFPLWYEDNAKFDFFIGNAL